MDSYFYEDGLESQRLVTRKLVDEDIRAWEFFFEDEEAVAFIPSYNSTDKKVKARSMIQKQLFRYSNNQYGLQALISKSHREFVGICGLLLQEVEGKMEIEIGYHLFRKHWGNGYATEAAQLFKKYAFEKYICNNVISIIDVNNLRSQRVALKNGMQREKQIHWANHNVFIYRAFKN